MAKEEMMDDLNVALVVGQLHVELGGHQYVGVIFPTSIHLYISPQHGTLFIALLYTTEVYLSI